MNMDLEQIKHLALAFNGTYTGKRERNHDGERGNFLAFRWDDADDADAFIDALDTWHDSAVCRTTNEHEDGVLTSIIELDPEVA